VPQYSAQNRWYRPTLSARNVVLLDAQRRDVEAVDHVLRSHHQPHVLARGHVQLVDLALAARMLRLPHPLLADDKDLQRVCGRVVELQIEVRAPDREADEDQQRRRGPPDLPAPGLLGGLVARGGARVPVLGGEQDQQEDDERGGECRDDEQRDEQEIERAGVGARAVRPEREARHLGGPPTQREKGDQ
jgi:hypothetical protein